MKILDHVKKSLSGKRERDPSYTLILSCVSEIAEKAAFAYINRNVRENVLKKKTVLADRTELTSEVRLHNGSTYFLNELMGINGVESVTLLYNE